MACLQHVSCLGNSNHAGAGRAPPSLPGRYPAVKVRKKSYVTAALGPPFKAVDPRGAIPKAAMKKAPTGVGAQDDTVHERKMPLVGQRRPALPRTDSAVPSALGGLTSGFGMGPGVPPLPWSLTNKGHSASGARRRALRAAQRDVGAPSGTLRRSEDEEKSSAD